MNALAYSILYYYYQDTYYSYKYIKQFNNCNDESKSILFLPYYYGWDDGAMEVGAVIALPLCLCPGPFPL